MNSTSEDISPYLPLLKSFEHYKDRIYKDSGHHPTVGWGHLIKKEDTQLLKVFEGDTPSQLRQVVADHLLEKDTKETLRLIKAYLPTFNSLPLPQRQALVSFAFNVGAGKAHKGGVFQAVESGNLEKAKELIKSYVYSNKKLNKGLETRREEEIKLLQTSPSLAPTSASKASFQGLRGLSSTAASSSPTIPAVQGAGYLQNLMGGLKAFLK